MVNKAELLAWINTLDENSCIGIDDDGLTLIEIGPDDRPTEAYIEIGGVPLQCAECQRSNGPHFDGPCVHR